MRAAWPPSRLLCYTYMSPVTAEPTGDPGWTQSGSIRYELYARAPGTGFVMPPMYGPVLRYRRCPTRRSRLLALALLAVFTLEPVLASAQSTGYLLPQEQGLEMIVHIMGEVQKPGEYRVPDRTDVLELLSKAGGPTEYSSLSSVTVRRVMSVEGTSTRASARREPKVSILKVDLKKAWNEVDGVPPPRLLPGDVVVVSRNSWFGYKRMSTVVRDVAVVASTYLLYLRVIKED